MAHILSIIVLFFLLLSPMPPIAYPTVLPLKFAPPYPTVINGDGPIRLAVGITCGPCETIAPIVIDLTARIALDCVGECQVGLVCRPGVQRDIPMAVAHVVDGVAVLVPELYCDTAYLQILQNAPTALSPTPKVSATLW
jgi:hypothetical protein